MSTRILLTQNSRIVYQMSTLVIWNIFWKQRERFRSMNSSGIEATDNFRFEILRSSQNRRRNRFDPNRFVIHIDTEKRCLAMFHRVSQG